MNAAEMVFEEWKTYAGKKALKKGALDMRGLISNSRLKIIGITGIRQGIRFRSRSDNYKGF